MVHVFVLWVPLRDARLFKCQGVGQPLAAGIAADWHRTVRTVEVTFEI